MNAKLMLSVAALGLMPAFAAEPGTTRDKGMEFDASKPLNFKVHFIARTATPPKLDGKLDDPCWQSAATLTDFAHATMIPPVKLRVAPTVMRYCWDDKYLYIAGQCYEDTPANMASYRTITGQKARAIHDRDVIELHIDGKNDEWTKHTAWLSGCGKTEGLWDYDFGWGLLTDTSWGVSADWTEAVGEGQDAKGQFWCVEAKIALADLEIQPRVGYIFGMEPTRFRFEKQWFLPDGKSIDALPGGVNGGCSRLQIYGWGTQGVWHQKKDRFGKCILVDQPPADLVAGLRLAYPDLDRRTVRIRGSEGYLTIEGGKTRNESYADKCATLLKESEAALRRLDPIVAIAEAPEHRAPAVDKIIADAQRFVEKIRGEIAAAATAVKAESVVTSVLLDATEKKSEQWQTDVEKKYYQTVFALLQCEKRVRFPVTFDGAAKPDFSDSPRFAPKMDEWQDPTLVAWGKPAAAGRKRVLAFVNHGDTFAVQHLRNRVDLDADIIETDRWGAVMRIPLLESALAHNRYDGFVFISSRLDRVPDKCCCALAEKLLDGASLITINCTPWGSEFKDDRDFPLGAPSFFDMLSEDRAAASPNENFESHCQGPSAYAVHWVTRKLRTPRIGTFGKGLVVACDTDRPESGTYMTNPAMSPSYPVTPDKVFQDEYCLAYACRLVMEGLGMRGPAKAKSIELKPMRPQEPVNGTLTLTSAEPLAAVVRLTLRDTWGKVVETTDRPVNLAAGDAKLTFAFKGTPPGDFWVDAIVLKDGKSCDFAAQRLAVKPAYDAPTIASLTADCEIFAKEADATATVKINNSEPGLAVVAELRDVRRRIIARNTFPVDAKTGTAKLSFPAERMRLNCHFIDAKLLTAAGEASSVASCWFFRAIGDIEDFRVFDGTSSHGGKDVEPRLAIIDWHGMDVLQSGSIARLFYGNDPAIRNRIPGSFSSWHGALNSPAWKAYLKKTYTKHAEDLKARNGRFISLGDDSGNPTGFVRAKCEWVEFFFRRLNQRLLAEADMRGVKVEVIMCEWCERHGLGWVKPSWHLYWGFRSKLETGSGLEKLMQCKLDADDVADIRAAAQEAYPDIVVFNLANGTRLRSFNEIDAKTIPTFKPIEKVEYPYFLVWLKARYHHDIGELNAAWGAKEKSFYTIEEKTIDELKRLGHFTAEIDKQTFLEDSFLMNCQIIGDAVHAVDPTMRVGFGASSLKSCLCDVFKHLDTAIPYWGRVDMDVIRSRKHGYIGETMGWYGTSYGSDEESVPKAVREKEAWHSLFSGANFCWMWTVCYGLNGARAVCPGAFGYAWNAHRDIQRGPGALVLRGQYETDGVRVLFSRDCEHMSAVKAEPTTHAVARGAWGAAINQLQLQYVHVTPDEIEAGALAEADVKVLVLPMADIVRVPTAAKISAFLKRGGTVLADFAPGKYGPDGKLLQVGTLDELLAKYPQSFRVLNQDLSSFIAKAGRGDFAAPRAALAKLFAKAGVKPAIRVVDAKGGLLAGVEVTRYTRGNAYAFAFERGSYAGESFPLKAFVELPEAGFVYDVRNGAFVKQLTPKDKRFEIEFTGMDERLFSFQKYEVKSLELTLNRPLRGGTLKVKTRMPGVDVRDTRVLRVEFVPPEGFPKTVFPSIKRYVEDAVGGKLELNVPMAFNERDDLVVEVTDVATGVTARQPLVFGEAPKYGSKKLGDVLLKVKSLSLPEGGRIDAPVVEAGKDENRTAYYRLTFKAKLSGGRFNYWWIDSFDRDGNLLADVNSKLYPSEDFREYDEIFQAEAKAVRLLPAFCTSKKSHWAAAPGKLEVRDVVLQRISNEEAAAWCDRLYRTLPQIDWSAPRDALWKLPKTWDKLTRHKPIKILLLGGSLCNDTYNGQVAAQLMREFPLSQLEVAASLRGGTGVWYYGQDQYFKPYVLDYHPDLVVVAGICHRGNTQEADIKDRERYFQRFIDKCKAHGLELVLCTPPMSKDFRSSPEVQEFDPRRTDPAYIDRSLLDRDYLDRLGAVNDIPVWDCTTAPYRALAASGAPLEAWMRDIVHCDDHAKQLNARAMVEHFRTAVSYQPPEGRMSHYSEAWFDWGELMPDGWTEPLQFVPGTKTCVARQPDGKILSQTYRLIEDPLEPGETEVNVEYSSPNPVVYTARYFDRHGTELKSETLTLKASAPKFARFRGAIGVPKGAVFVRHEFTFSGGFKAVTFGMGKHRMREG